MEAALQALIAAVVAFIAIFLLFSLILFLYPRTPKCRFGPSALPAPPLPLRRPLPTSVVADESASFDPPSTTSPSTSSLPPEGFAADAIISDDSFGSVYKARLSSGATVAVKRLSADAFHGFCEFRAEIETLDGLHHPQLTSILGYCISGADRLLIYEFVEHGSLDHWLHESDSFYWNKILSFLE
uniref:Proline-rich receptor-like protein kinase PERK5 n=1 Tax=Elaeis guineensis var. tenera TaxID=51953 RepID=A0A6I9QCQ0_ELAGV|nr:proline-rich receptor-like protein kinase PERK5 [Elaeis guineensis]